MGYIQVRNQLIQWVHNRDLTRRNLAQSIDGTTSYLKSNASEKYTEAMSVMTPSVANFSRATSTDHRNHHFANPNPAATQTRYFGPRDLNDRKNITASTDAGGDLIRFSKRVNFQGRLDNAQLLEEQLKQMRTNMQERKL